MCASRARVGLYPKAILQLLPATFALDAADHIHERRAQPIPIGFVYDLLQKWGEHIVVKSRMKGRAFDWYALDGEALRSCFTLKIVDLSTDTWRRRFRWF